MFNLMDNYSHLLEEDLDYSWLGIKIPDKITDPFGLEFESNDPLDIASSMTKFMLNSEYLHFTVKHLFNIDLLPFQCVMLDVLWTKKFPIIVAARGGSKSTLLAIYTLLRLITHPN